METGRLLFILVYETMPPGGPFPDSRAKKGKAETNKDGNAEIESKERGDAGQGAVYLPPVASVESASLSGTFTECESPTFSVPFTALSPKPATWQELRKYLLSELTVKVDLLFI